MIREGSPDITLAYLAKHRNVLAVSMFSDGQSTPRGTPNETRDRRACMAHADPWKTAQTQGRNIRHYANYLSERARAYRDTKIDWVRGRENRLEKLSVDKGLLRETEAVQNQLSALLKCDVSVPMLSVDGHDCS